MRPPLHVVQAAHYDWNAMVQPMADPVPLAFAELASLHVPRGPYKG